jgi:hypothetical protein
LALLSYLSIFFCYIIKYTIDIFIGNFYNDKKYL